ncbi:Planctomycete cytochrome C [Neorhodopirellula lusitana]|uniref:Planctomycete cytochrome C n=1 Tax=Neorhodopirellula lusitana TaxID=445327 RepID=A0ABY1Q7C3_9BACT|nr:PSD1 and planctomycete cytochrome C domain-containing protein [Neorhodopirellula lusitana]SMP61967.1 Planctomycete cytochrome C [Neorhodopirellula lusitana]
MRSSVVRSIVFFAVLVALCWDFQPASSAESDISNPTSGADLVDFESDIAPILEDNCWYCHGEDEQESGLRLDSRLSMLRGGDSGLATIVPGKPEKSYLIEVVDHIDEEMAMPPDEDKLAAEDIELLARWIREGAVWPGQMQELKVEKSDHWSFQPVIRPTVPTSRKVTESSNLLDSHIAIDSGDATESGNVTKSSNAIDAFLLDRLRLDSLAYSEPADPRTLIRRVSIVLTGIPPTPEQTEAFVDEYARDGNAAYTRLVDHLMSSPHFGERWAQHWLDVIRWAETNGSESNMYRKNAWIYRDYVIRAFNEDKPYDRFLFEQLAGDTVGVGDATGYLVAGPHVPAATVGREPAAQRTARADRMDEILQTVGASAMGMTIGCARCHNHKFDPISISDYYSMSAVFQDIEFGGRFLELSKDHPRRVRGQELHGLLKTERIKMRSTGPWEENWTGYKEIHLPFTTAKAVRFTFPVKFLRIDELEIFGTDKWNENLALATAGTTVEHSEEITKESMPITKINDGEYGNYAWMVRVPKGNDQKPWVQFNFTEPHEIFRVRISTNREDYFETDYLENLNKLMFGAFEMEVQDESGVWSQVASTNQIAKLDQQHPERVATLKEVQRLVDLIKEEGPAPGFVARFIEPVTSYVFSRGSPESPRDEVYPAGLKELDGDLGLDSSANGKTRRVEFANWLTDPANPLTARVAVNRMWHHIFGRGIVSTTADFGAAGAAPTHPELLDWLASELIEPTEFGQPALQVGDSAKNTESQPWSMKHMIRLMVMSGAFRQSSLPNDGGLQKDGNAALLWRFPPKRVEAEVIRDSILQASGLLDEQVGGRSFRIHNVKERYAQWEVTNNYGPETWRRMIYQERMRRVDDQMFTAFDFPDCGQVKPKRPVSTTPLQALNLMNSTFVMQQSEMIAARAISESGGPGQRAVERCFELILGRSPSVPEIEAVSDLVSDGQLSLVCRALINSNEFAFLP